MINTRSLTESLERKYNLNESYEIELEESFIFRPTPDDEPGEWGLNTQEELEREILRYDGKKIIKMVQTSGSIFTEHGYFNITLEDQTYLEGVSEECIVHSTNESIQEDYWNPTPWFYDLTNNYETWSGEEWNNWSQEERDAVVTKAVKHFLIDNQLSEYEVEEFRRDLEDNNFHTEARILSELCGTINESLSDEDIYDNLAGKLFNAAERFFMYSSDKITYDEWIRACEKAFFALEDEGHTCDDSNSINEDITEENLHIYKDVVNYLVTELDNFEGQHPCNEVESKVSGYSGDWCSEEGYGDYIEKATRAKNNYARALADVYFENAK